jgi:hypothetical protein
VDADRASKAVNGPAAGVRTPRIDLSGTQTAGAAAIQPKPLASTKRPAEEQLISGANKKAVTDRAMTDKQARVEDVAEDKEATSASQTQPTPTKKRLAFTDPEVLREAEDGGTKRTRNDESKARMALLTRQPFSNSQALRTNAHPV